MDTAHNVFTLLRLHHEIELDRNIENRRRSNQIQPHNIFATLTKVWRTTKPYSPWSLMTKTHKVIIKLPPRPPAFMVSTCFGLWQETLPENSNAPSTNDTLYQLQACMAEMECCHKEEHRKLKADHDELEASVRRPQGDDTLLIRSTNTSRVNHIPIKPTIHGRPQCLTHTPPWTTDNSSTTLFRLHHGGWPAFRLETPQHEALWWNH